MHGQELASWKCFCFHFFLMDAWIIISLVRIEQSLEYSRSDRRNNGVNLSRLDRFYVSKYLQISGAFIEIVGGTSFSDHAPVSLNILQERRSPVTQIRMADSIIQDISF